MSAITAMNTFSLTFLEYNTLLASVPKIWKEDARSKIQLEGEMPYKTLIHKKNISRVVYQELTYDENALAPKEAEDGIIVQSQPLKR